MSLNWVEFDIPGGSEPVQMARLLEGPDSRDFSLLVKFPAGWERPDPGHYVAAEEVSILEGTLIIGDLKLEPGHWAFLPHNYLRTQMRAETEVVAKARFYGPPKWIPGTEGSTTEGLLTENLFE